MDSQLISRLKLNGIFCQVVESGSMRKAASCLDISPSAISQFIRQLESELGITLLHRSTRKHCLSEAGERYYENIRKAINAIKDAENAVSEVKNSLSGNLRIALPVGLATTPVAKALYPLLTNNPELKIEIHAKDGEINIIEERIDIEVNVGQPKDSGMYYHYLGTGTKHLFISPTLLAKKGYPNQQRLNHSLAQYPWLGLSTSGVLSNITLNHTNYDSLNFCPKFHMKFNDLNSLISHNIQGLGVALLPELEVKDHVNNGQLVKLLPNWSLPKFEIHALTVDKFPPYKIKEIIKALHYYFNHVNQQTLEATT